jgi:hypothetical protein
MPSIWLDAYNWADNTFKQIGDTISYTTPDTGDTSNRYEPIILTVQGREATNRTDYRTSDSPELSDYDLTSEIEFYADGIFLITNVEFEVLGIPRDSVVTTYTGIVDAIKIRTKLFQVSTPTAPTIPGVDSYTVELNPVIYPKVNY